MFHDGVTVLEKKNIEYVQVIWDQLEWPYGRSDFIFIILSNDYFTNGIDIHFDNVDGYMLDAVLKMKNHGKTTVCRMDSQQNLPQPQGIAKLPNLVIKIITMQGFLHSDYLHFCFTSKGI